MNTTSSLCRSRNWRERNSAPNTGSSEAPATRSMLRVPSSVSRPAITSVSFSRRFTSVSARRLIRPGTCRTATSKLIEEISVAIFAAIVPASLATGATSNLMPYSLNDTEAVPSAPDTGMGSSPPATKRAVPPERQDNRGSASTTASPFCTRKFSIEVTDDSSDRLLAKAGTRARMSAPLPSPAPPGCSAPLRDRSPRTWKLGPCELPFHLTPMFSSSSRRISMNLTSIAIMRSSPTFGIRLTTCG